MADVIAAGQVRMRTGFIVLRIGIGIFSSPRALERLHDFRYQARRCEGQ